MPTEPTVDELIQQLERVHIEEARIVEQIKQERLREGRRTPVAVAIGVPLAGVTTNGFRIGQRVRVNNVRDERNHLQGTVTKVTDTRVYLRTDNGYTTWRAH